MINLKDSEFRELTTYMKTNYGINLTEKKLLIEGRLSNMITEKGFSSFSDYLKFVFKDCSGNEISTLINKLTTNHTFFMREADHFEYFRDEVLPYLEASSKNKDLRIWSAGCSSGEEPYTLAMIIADYFGDQKFMWNTRILATDISEKVLEIAEKGIYSQEAVNTIPKYWGLRYFNKITDKNYEICEEIRNEIIYRNFNLMTDIFPFKKKFHIIFCRNVMIYFDPKTKTELINKFYEMTEPGGYLFIGHSESVNKNETKYKYIMPAVYRKG
ncbi:protein-glutamate O-methyltransferase CheR [Clostridium tagluense]|uniref:CheR family methyltransferase n=1 Tax=Clostridium tagluense TaxID=360422 RepID=UPI001C0DA565|nr:protein-glutamate O-methyltransferase CheR [Clostridium tagluense]MBU3127597.1 protein-glutamate O-methyltransferase CheR [Clostridium tagluense]MCB2312613.1 protein-glutamate O-methyltransferase CheR [Clostridium tagluense]MCB2317289.1 protein-glutamate O-methyltransferase CheR [Clostridium tagluense]MCB2322156.1 protein-glutamate O-methyltransferase CheR [Clostridium tagluense]MCB2327085.1 protein-glutamate O-methyltransferase CheR [Clostridium tagluense]